jgi:hypothetical protein
MALVMRNCADHLIPAGHGGRTTVSPADAWFIAFSTADFSQDDALIVAALTGWDRVATVILNPIVRTMLDSVI